MLIHLFEACFGVFLFWCEGREEGETDVKAAPQYYCLGFLHFFKDISSLMEFINKNYGYFVHGDTIKEN